MATPPNLLRFADATSGSTTESSSITKLGLQSSSGSGKASPLVRGGNKDKFVVILPNIRSRHNVGAIFRTADGAGVDKLYLTGYTPQPPHKDIDKVALGAEKTMPWEYVKQTARVIKKLKSEGFHIVGLEQTKKSVTIYSYQPVFPLALILGNEVTGIPRDLQKLCDTMVELPMRGEKNSLNVSIATGIMLYHIAQFKI